MKIINNYSVSGLFQEGASVKTFPNGREGLASAYEWVGNAFAWQIKFGEELVDQFDPWREDDEDEARKYL